MTERIRIGRRSVELTHPDKVLFTGAGLTKHDLAAHYERVAPMMLPYVSGRPLALQAFPGGIDRHGYFMKAVPDHFPEWIDRVTVEKRGGFWVAQPVDAVPTLTQDTVERTIEELREPRETATEPVSVPEACA